MAYIVMAHIVMAHIAMAHIAMAYEVMSDATCRQISKSKWVARVRVGVRDEYLGYFTDEEVPASRPV